jgi:hypothetical protein
VSAWVLVLVLVLVLDSLSLTPCPRLRPTHATTTNSKQSAISDSKAKFKLASLIEQHHSLISQVRCGPKEAEGVSSFLWSASFLEQHPTRPQVEVHPLPPVHIFVPCSGSANAPWLA